MTDLMVTDMEGITHLLPDEGLVSADVYEDPMKTVCRRVIGDRWLFSLRAGFDCADCAAGTRRRVSRRAVAST